MRGATIRIPEEAARAIHAEAHRTLQRPGEVLAELVRCYLPEFVRERLRHDLTHPISARVIDARAELVKPQDANDAEAGLLGVVSDHSRVKGRSDDKPT